LPLKSTKELDPLHFPAYEFRFRQNESGQEIWDVWRKRWIRLTPEEWVRQHLGRYLMHERQFPGGRMVMEKSLSVLGMKRRADLLVYSSGGEPLFLAECKAPSVNLSQAVADQAAAYNLVFKVPYLMVTNGIEHRCCLYRQEEGRWEWLPEVPVYTSL
jgi:hypothetical protein